MIRTLRESKAKLSELVERAGCGEDVLPSVRRGNPRRAARGAGSALIYRDASALAKLYVAEPDWAHFLGVIAGGDESVASSAITATELLCVLYRKEHMRAQARIG